LRIRKDVPLAPLTTLGVGGAARFFAVVKDEARLAEALAFARRAGVPVFALGGGSNLVVSDGGFAGMVVKMAIPGIEPDAERPGRVSVGAGVEWDEFVRYCVRRGLAGVEALSGIPGSVGGAPVQNIGAYGQEVGDAIACVYACDVATGEVVRLGRRACAFGYRSSVFNGGGRGRRIVTRVVFDLAPGGAPVLGYAELQRLFAQRPAPTLRQVREAVLGLRKAKGMLRDPDDPDSRSAGSFFKNPVIAPGEFGALEEDARRRGVLAPQEAVPHFAAPGGGVKLSAAWLIEHAGFHKGHRRGRAGISRKHALALVNGGGATAGEVLGLARAIQAGVRAAFGVELDIEPVVV
jgi:UDP-N-acetylmuramate dehydrogenase